MPSAYNCIRCFEQRNEAQSEKQNVFETKLERVGSLKSILKRLPIFVKTFAAHCSHSLCPVAHIKVELKFASTRPDS